MNGRIQYHIDGRWTPKWMRAAALSTSMRRPPEWGKGGWQEEDKSDSLGLWSRVR
jgi:hypothetical protein